MGVQFSQAAHYMAHRLNKFKERQVAINSLLTIIFLFSLVIIFIFFGFRAIVGSAMFFSQENEKIDNNKEDEVFFGSITLDSLPVSTNSSSLLVTGQVDGFDKVKIFLNDEEVHSLIPKNGVFEYKINQLKIGDNEVYAEGMYKDRKTSITEVENLEYDNTPPLIDIDFPQNNSSLNSVDITLTGKVNEDVTLKLNNRPVVVAQNGVFYSPVKLQTGENKVLLLAEDRAGNRSEKEIIVNVNPDN